MAAALISVFILAYMTIPVFAASNYIQITGDSVSVRSNAGLFYSVIGEAHKGDRYVCLGEKKDSTGQKWYYVRFSDSKSGWITAQYAKTVSGPDSAPSKKVQITGSTVNVRTGNGNEYSKLGVVMQDGKYDYLGSSKAAGGVVWYKIQFSSNRTGWVTSKYSKLITVSSSTADKETVQKTSATKKTSSKITAAADTSPTAQRKITPWAVTATATASAAQKYIKVTDSSANVHSSPGSSHTTLGTVKRGSIYRYLDSGKASDGAVWYKIQYTSGKVGWIASVSANIIDIPIDVPNEVSLTSAQSAVNSAAKKYGAVGVQVAVIKKGQVTDTYNYGYATKGGAAMKSDSKIRIASISKVVVGMNAMKMQEQGIVDIDESIGVYWNNSPYKSTTLRKLLTHTSYLKDNQYIGTKSGTANQLKSPACYRSSNSWMYNNYGVGVAGSTLEVASGQTLNSYTEKNFFAPLGIDASFTSGNLKDTSKLATLYYPSGSVARSISNANKFKTNEVGQNTAYFAGGLTISAEDMAKLVAILANDGVYDGRRYLSEESVKIMETQQCSGYSRGRSFKQCIPLRYQTDIYGQSKMYYHLGTAYGTLAYAGYNPDTKNGVVIITTGASDSYDSYGIFNVCADIAKYFFNQ